MGVLEEALVALGSALVPLVRDAFAKGATREDILKAAEASMVAASDVEMRRELGDD
jgi:hypothetical protein